EYGIDVNRIAVVRRVANAVATLLFALLSSNLAIREGPCTIARIATASTAKAGTIFIHGVRRGPPNNFFTNRRCQAGFELCSCARMRAFSGDSSIENSRIYLCSASPQMLH